MAKKFSVLLVCPMSTGQLRIHDLTWQSIQGIAWDQPIDILFLRDDKPTTPHMTNLTAKMNRARDIFLHSDYDAMWVVESDMIVPPHTLQRFSRAKADVIYGLYCSRHRDHPWLAFKALQGNGQGDKITPDHWGKIVSSQGVGFGCTLIRRNVLESLSFREGPDGQWPDWNFSLDLASQGFKQVHDLGVVCGHIIEPQRVLWPIGEAPYHLIDDYIFNAKQALIHSAVEGEYALRTAITSITTGLTTQAGETVYLSAAQAADFLKREIVDLVEGDS